MQSFPVLYGVEKNGKIKQWSIQVDKVGQYAKVTTLYGQMDGKMQETERFYEKGKNIGKKNETTSLI